MDNTNGSDRRPSKPTLASNPHNPNSAAYLAYPVKHVVSSLYRRLTEAPEQPVARLLDAPNVSHQSGVYTPPRRTASPFQPPPLTPLTLKSSHKRKSHILTQSLSEEIRLLVPPRLQLVDSWCLAYSLETDGASLATLYKCCENMSTRSQRAGYVIVVRDSSNSKGSIFGAYLSDPPKPSPHYFGTGECFLWRASILPSIRDLRVFHSDNKAPPSKDLLELSGLPPPPSADTTNLHRFTTVCGEKDQKPKPANDDLREPPVDSQLGISTPDRIRFKAFPYSGMNEFMIFCEPSFLSVGGGDGRYGLWLDDTLEKGISDTCLTFGNEPLSEEGHNFSVLDMEIWYIGA